MEERDRLQRKQYTTIEKGIYICGDIIEFKSIDLFDGIIS